MKFDILKPLSVSGSGRRAIQEDSMYPALGEGTIHDKLFIVCDGIGDDGKGYSASDYFCRTLPDFFFQNTCPDEPLDEGLLQEALQETCRKLQKRCPDGEGVSFAMLYFHRQGCLVAHVGNARVYQFRPRSNTLLYKSVDDDRVFAPDAENVVQPVKVCLTDVEYGDYFLLVTKGVHQMLSDEQLMGLVSQPGSDTTKQAQFIKALSDSADNYSLTMVHVSGVMREEGDELRSARAQAPRQVKPASVSPRPAAQEVRRPAAAPAEPSDKLRVQAKPQTRQERAPERRPLLEEEQPVVREKKERSFPIVAVTAATIVALAGIFWFVSQRPNNDEKEAPVVEVKKDSVKKDTINIMKSETPKPIKGLEEEKKKKEEEKSAYQPPKQEETSADTSASVPAAIDRPAVQPTEQKPVEEPAVETRPQRQEPVTTPAGTPADPNTVTPRPVIPEDE